MTSEFIAQFEDIGKSDVPLVGGKGANLGEMTSIGMPVPSGFVVTALAYRFFLEKSGLKPKLEAILKDLDVNKPKDLDEASRKIKQLIVATTIPKEISAEILTAYKSLDKKSRAQKSHFKSLLSKLSLDYIPVAVRSSATSEDSKDASFAGQNATFLNISGPEQTVFAVRRCWASLFEARSIFYRVQNHFDHFKSYIAVVVQLMVQSEVSGIMFSIDPVTNNKNRVVIETVWGLGEFIVQGKVTPDHYEVNKEDLLVVERKFVPQHILLTRTLSSTKETKVPSQLVAKRKLSDDQIKDLAALSLKLETHYNFPQDSEFAVSKGKIYLVQTRPITTTEKKSTNLLNKVDEKTLSQMPLILTGAPASPGVKSGPVKVLAGAQEIDKIVPGDILVASQTNPDYVPAMKKAAAIVTDKGGRTSHAAIVSRELGIPCVVGTESATRLLKNGQQITVDGSSGKVHSGALATTISTEAPEKARPAFKTKTHVYVNLAEPEKAKEIAALDCDGVGLLRAEFMLAGIGVHPKKVIQDKKQKDYIAQLTDKLTIFAEAFYPRPVVYRATDFKTNEYRTLKGGDKFEPHEENPMIGFRGAYRYIVEPEVFAMELEAIKNVRQKAGFKNLWLMIPFCRTVEELRQVKSLVTKAGLERSANFKLWMMCEIPSNVILLDKFIEVGIDGISVGSNDLTMLTLGVDRDNEMVASEYNELNEAVLESFERIIQVCRKYSITCSMCGQAPSDYPALTEKLVEWGTTSVSVNPDVIDKTRYIVHQAEQKLSR